MLVLVKDGKTWHWCPHHKLEGSFDGLYYHNHTPATHDEWKKSKRRRNSNTTWPKPGALTDASPKHAPGSLQIADALKKALFTDFFISEDDHDKIFQQTLEQEN